LQKWQRNISVVLTIKQELLEIMPKLEEGSSKKNIAVIYIHYRGKNCS
jgi:hypothetical protein